MKLFLAATLLTLMTLQPALAASSDDMPFCDRLVALYMELAKRSGETVTEAQTRAEVLSENPTEAECAAMLALFETQK